MASAPGRPVRAAESPLCRAAEVTYFGPARIHTGPAACTAQAARSPARHRLGVSGTLPEPGDTAGNPVLRRAGRLKRDQLCKPAVAAPGDLVCAPNAAGADLGGWQEAVSWPGGAADAAGTDQVRLPARGHHLRLAGSRRHRVWLTTKASVGLELSV